MSKNLRHQLRSTVFNNFKEGAQKHSIKIEDRSKIGVWSYGTRNDYLDKINNFCDWARENGINKIEQVTSHTIHDFLEEKATQDVTDRTLNAYRSVLGRLGELQGRDWHCEPVKGVKTLSRARGVDSTMDRADLERICSYARENPSRSGACILLERQIGVRVADLSYGVEVKDQVLDIRSKNGKHCTRAITPEIREIINSKEFRSMVDEKGHLNAPKDDSINKYLRRVEDKLGLERHSFHDIRRCVAQEKYDSFRNQGFNRDMALKQVSIWLNHGPNRQQMMLDSYIGKAW